MAEHEKNGLVIDQITDEEILDWGEVGKAQTARKYIPKYGKWVTIRTSIPLDKLAEIQAMHPGKNARDQLKRYVAMLRYVIVEPPITDESARAVAKADSSLMMEILSFALGKNDEKLLEDGLTDPE